MAKKSEVEIEVAEPRVQVRHNKQVLAVFLTQEEMLEQAKKMAEATEDAERAESDRKSSATHYKALEEEAQGKARAARCLLRNGYDYREVPVTITKDWDTKTVTITRDDTGAVVSAREMRDSELQIEIATEEAPTDEDAA